MRRFITKRRMAVAVALMALAGIATVAAIAYITEHATSAPTAMTGTVPGSTACASTTNPPPNGDCSIVITAASISSLAPGGSVQVGFNVRSGASSPARTFSLASPTLTVTTSDPANCPASWFSGTGYAWTTGTGTPAPQFNGLVATFGATSAGVTIANGQFNLNMANDPGPQDACVGKTITLTLGI